MADNIRPRNSVAKLVTLAVAAVFLLSACTTTPSGGGPSSSATPSNVATTPSASSQAETTPAANAASADADAALQAQLDDRWEMILTTSPDAVRPVVEMVRYVSQDEWAPAIAGCMQDLGWPDTTATPDGGVESGSIQNSQVGAHDIAMYTCDAKYPMDPKYSIPLTDDKLNELYDYFADDLQPCLEAEGYETPPAPSREKFAETYTETGGWNLYENVTGGGQDGWYEINEKCPQIPVDFYE